jgi:hypothetical protein
MRIAITTLRESVLCIRVARLLLSMSAAVFVYRRGLDASHKLGNADAVELNAQGSPFSRLKGSLNLHHPKAGFDQ